MQKQEGFTLIELIVVIAIISILAAIIIVSVLSYITKAKNEAIETDIIPLQVITVSDLNNGGSIDSNFCFKSDVTDIVDALRNINSDLLPVCGVNSDNGDWCFCSTIFQTFGMGNFSYCVDSTGFRGELPDICTCSNDQPKCQ